MINAVFEEQLAATIANTEVPREHRRVFLGVDTADTSGPVIGVEVGRDRGVPG